MFIDSHPDRNQNPEAVDQFRGIVTAYELLFDENSREEYDEYLLHPERFYRNAAVFYRRMWVGKKENLWTVLIGAFTLCVVIDHVYRKFRYESLKRIFRGHPVVQKKVLEFRKHNGTLSPMKKGKKKEIEITDEELHQAVDLVGESFEEPTFRNLLIFRSLDIAYFWLHLACWALRWVLLFWIMKRPYGQADRIYLTREKLSLSVHEWESLEEEQQNRYLALDLWIEANHKRFQLEEKKAIRAKKRKY